MEKETSEEQIGVSTVDITCNLSIVGDKKVLERKRPVEQRTEGHPFSICIVLVIHGS